MKGSSCELPECKHGICVCGHAECGHADQNVQPNCSDCDCNGFKEHAPPAPTVQPRWGDDIH